MLPIIAGIASFVVGFLGGRKIVEGTDKMEKDFKKSNLNLSDDEIDRMFLNEDV
ncbi:MULTISPECIES: hypothetical protein [Candidatus Brocadia]|uniref:Ribosomal protein S3 n=1 Tax=Candidatus Brocadia sinica JPN1 TaxID=1197129 RepID=A0ABQ0JUL8_9BACT|nr:MULTISPECIES: hypothetical protein [Brocadia]NOG41663.1 hypothetical protein [Planctomycetota bacterium]GAN32449.1 ribosomal protein S3 [Candidatus Brocadia sinica JPN1]GIK14005.1 MAG: hypothetical protein BroJett002_27120 [Candidatus Brocadia sinica]GJQ19136.1 MAG: hypothetical protein HBSIN01_30950 [Candidatus Brocadia sinica]